MSAEKTTIHTIARATGLSLATVSRALAGSPSVLPQTRDKVLDAARAFNYVRDRAAVRLKTGKTQVIAFIMDRLDASQPGFKDLLLGLGDAVAGTDYHLIVLPESTHASEHGSEPGGEHPGVSGPLAAVRYVVERGLADGLVLTHTEPQDERVRYLQQKAFPFITHGRTRLPQPHGFVDFANEQFAALAVQGLAARGRQRLGMLLPVAGSVFRGHLSDGFQAACAARVLAGECVENLSLDDPPEAIYQWARQHGRRFDGLVVSREAPVLPLISALTDCGMAVGQTIDLVIKYSSPLPHYIRQPFMACHEDLHLAGQTLGQSLLAHFSGSGAASAQVLFAPPPLALFHGPG